MPSFNKVLLMGNLTRDPQVKSLSNEQAVANFGMACNRKYRSASGEDREEVTFVECVAFGRQAEVLAQYCRKGRPLMLEGHLKFDAWEDKEGVKHNRLCVVVESFQFVGGRDGSPNSQDGSALSEQGDKRQEPPSVQAQRPARPAAQSIARQQRPQPTGGMAR